MIHSTRSLLSATLACVFALGVMVYFSGNASAQDMPESVNLQPQWQQGQTSTYETWSRRQRDITMSAAGQSRQNTVVIETQSQTTWAVQRVAANGSSTCTMTFDWITATLDPGEGPVLKNDSRQSKGDSEQVHDLVRAMAGMPITVEVASDGSITKVTGTEAIRKRAKFPDLVPKDLDFIESAAELATLWSAPAQADVSSTWNADFRWTHELGHLNQRLTYRVDTIEDVAGIPLATVTGQGKLTLDVDRSKFPPEGPPVDVRMTAGNLETQIMFDLDRHEAVGRNTTQTTTIEVNIRLPQQTLTQRTDETIQSQVLRLSEE